MQSSQNAFQENVRANTEVCAALRGECEKLFDATATATLYGLPQKLIASISREAPKLASAPELKFEQDLSALLQRNRAVGLVDGKLIHSSLFEERSPIKISREDFDALGWTK